MGESLQGAIRAVQAEKDTVAARIAARQREQEERRQEQQRLTRERADQFVAIMREKGVPQIGVYAEDSILVPARFGTRREVRGIQGPQVLGWLAFEARESWTQDYQEKTPGAFVAEDGTTYECGNTQEFEGTEYIATPRENSTILGTDSAVHSMARFLVERGLAD